MGATTTNIMDIMTIIAAAIMDITMITTIMEGGPNMRAITTVQTPRRNNSKP